MSHGGICMHNKNNIKKAIIISQILGCLFLVCAFLCLFYLKQGYELLVFEKTIILDLHFAFSLSFILTEIILVIILVKKGMKPLILLTYLVLIPLTLLLLYSWLACSSTTTAIKIYKYPEFDTAIVIESGHDLLGDYYRFYETSNNILMKKITVTSSGMSSLEDETSYDIKTVNETIIFTYEDGFDENQIILEYNNGHFEYE